MSSPQGDQTPSTCSFICSIHEQINQYKIIRDEYIILFNERIQ